MDLYRYAIACPCNTTHGPETIGQSAVACFSCETGLCGCGLERRRLAGGGGFGAVTEKSDSRLQKRKEFD